MHISSAHMCAYMRLFTEGMKNNNNHNDNKKNKIEKKKMWYEDVKI